MFHGQFNNPQTSTGLNKIFYNIGYIVYDTIYRHTDIDTKDITINSENERGRVIAPILRGTTRAYLDRAKFGEKLNDMRQVMLRDGTVYVKMVGNMPYIVDPFNIIEPAYQDGVGTMAERIYLTAQELRDLDLDFDVFKEKHTVDMLIEQADMKNQDIIAYEYWLEKEGVITCELHLSTELLESDEQNKDEWSPYIQIDEYESPNKDKDGNITYPYRKGHMIKVQGRRIGFSIFELTKGIIENYNELMNINREKSLLDMRGIFTFRKGMNSRAIPQSFVDKIGLGGFLELERDENIERLPYQYLAGEVMTTADNLFNLARQVGGATAMDTGEDLPSRVSATAVMYSKQNANSTYDVVRENLGLFLEDFFENLYMPVIIRDLKEEDASKILGEPYELRELDDILVRTQVNNELNTSIEADGYANIDGVIVTSNDQSEDIIEERKAKLAKQGDTRWGRITDALLEGLKYSISINITSDSFDKIGKIQNMQTLMQMPDVNLSKERIGLRTMDLLGEDPRQFELSDKEMADQIMQQEQAQGAGQQNFAGQPLQPKIQNAPQL
ncbi:MAG: hypothetical protein DRI24_24025 [Deltaproteobacteria bacterium]|nr:MAG: hypothetical protein DRI24_24025 [Deltaproteobacteria bacterium]